MRIAFASAFERWLKSIYENGIEQTIRLYLDEIDCKSK
jgi:hypothetical protein